MIGTTLSQYRILERLGAGGMGEVYRAHDQRLGRDVALKLLPPDLISDPTARARMLREARTASALNHPNICTIYEVGEADGHAYIAMECIEGRPMGEVIGARGLPPEVVARYGAQVADALAHAHERGVIHRDLKASNVLVTPDGRVKVLDFGLARRFEESPAGGHRPADITLTEVGAIAGTPHCLAPEVLRGSRADQHSDLWALGVLLYEMACGARPFRGETGVELSVSILNDPPAPLPPRVPATICSVIGRCLAKDPAQRYRQANEVRAALEALGAGSRPELPATSRRAPSGRLLRWLAGAVVLVLVVLTNPGGLRDRLTGRIARGPIASLAVLPLDNFSRDAEQDYFADGMTEELITNLAQIGAVRVISRTSVMRFKDTKLPLPEIARQLKVDAIVEGSVQRLGDRVRISAQLVRAATDEHLWAKSYERDLRDALALQDEVARAIAGEIQARLTPQQAQRLASARPVDPEVYELFLKGREQYQRRTRDGRMAAIHTLEQAVARDTTYAPGYAALAEAYVWRPELGSDRSEAIRGGRRAIERALALDPDLGEAHAAKAFLSYREDWDWVGSEREFTRAIELSPSSVEAHHRYSHLLMALGRIPESLEQSQLALAVDPLYAGMKTHLGWHYYMAGQLEQAVEQLENTARTDPGFGETHRFLTLVYTLKGRYADALAEHRKAVGLGAVADSNAKLALIRAAAGQRDAALHVLGAAMNRAERGEGSAYEVASVFAVLGLRDRAFSWLDRAFEERDVNLPEIKLDPFLASLRSDPRFQALLRRMELPV